MKYLGGDDLDAALRAIFVALMSQKCAMKFTMTGADQTYKLIDSGIYKAIHSEYTYIVKSEELKPILSINFNFQQLFMTNTTRPKKTSTWHSPVE